MESIEVSAKTLDDAILEAAIKLGTTREKVAYDVICQGSAGFFGIGSKKAVIKAWEKSEAEIEASQKADKEVEKILERVNEKAEKAEKAERAEKIEKPAEKKPAEKKAAHAPAPKKERQEKPAAPKKVQEKPVQPAVVSGEKAETEEKEAAVPAEPVDTKEVEKFLHDVFAAMDMKVELQIEQKPKDREMSIDLSGDDMGVLIGKRGQTLDSLQYLASLVVNKGTNEYIRVKLDTENYRERRKATLENLAKNIAQKVKRTRKPVSLEPMNPYERRVIHSALQNDKFVSTHSEGEEPFRRVVVTPKEGVRYENYNNRNRNRYNRNYNKKKER